ncbi:uncharacterized protein si:ch211-136m16.8 [Alosa alosa]|nr:uncharacterized protein si:ch211-136m16.8 [Alosa alosa]
MADTEFVPCGAPEEMTLMDMSVSNPVSESIHRQQEEAELKIKMPLSKESKSLDEGSELELKGSTTATLTDLSVEEELMESDVIFTAEAETDENPELSEGPMDPKAPPESIIPESEREFGEESVHTGRTQVQELCRTGSMSSDEDNEHRETQEELRASESNLVENKSELLEDKAGNESAPVAECQTDMNEEAELEDTVPGERDGITAAGPDDMEEDLQKALPEDMAGLNEEPDVEDMATIEVRDGEATHLDDRLLKRKLERAGAEEEALEDEPDVTAGPKRSSLDFSVQKSRIAVKNPLVRPPKDPRSLLNLASLQPTPRARPRQDALPGDPNRKPPARGVPPGGAGVMGVKLPGLGAGFPVLRKTNREPKEEERAQSSLSQKSDSEQKQTEDAAEEGQTKSKPKWTPPKHAIGMGTPFMMAELKGKLRKSPEK